MGAHAVDMKVLLEGDLREFAAIDTYKVEQGHIEKLVEEYKGVMLTTIINQFGLGPYLDSFKNGGNVTTLHNAQNDVFSNEADAGRYKESFNRKNYEKDFPQKRKRKFQMSDSIYDDYTGKQLSKDGSTHLDHVVSAKSIHSNDEARLYMNDEERNKMATSEENLAWTNSSLNQSKNDKDLDDWMDLENRKNPDKTNAEHYEVNRDAASEKNKEAIKHVSDTVKNAKVSYYTKNVISTGVDQGYNMGKKQAIGLLIYEFQLALTAELKGYFENFKAYKTIKNKIAEFKNVCGRVSKRVLSKAKDILIAFGEGFIGGFIANIVTIFINTFATTAKNIARILNDGLHALIKAFKLLVAPPKGISMKEAVVEASKIFTTAIVGSVGVILTEAFSVYLKTTPFSPFADLIAGVFGGILTGIVSVTLVYVIDNFQNILRGIGEAFQLIKYQLTMSAEKVRDIYHQAISGVEEEYRLILNRIYQEYEELDRLQDFAFDCGALSNVQFENSIKLAKAHSVTHEEIVLTESDIDDFFIN
ncbi:ECF transporter S component [Bacillus cereus]|nr:hypothetical protein bcere0021_8100 [Bacillus cereus Rock3-42]MDA1843841.1 ECF transporter S component [Bacillus cereus]MDA1852406.1 ECF transporter S component [Bacillus cereus]